MQLSGYFLVITAKIVTILSAKFNVDSGGLQRIPGLYGEDCTPVVVQTSPGGKETTWSLVSGPDYKIAADKHCRDPCAYEDKAGKLKGVYCIPRDKVDGTKCCAYSYNKPSQEETLTCHQKMKLFGLGDKPIPNCPWGYGIDMGPHDWQAWFPDCHGNAQSPINIELDQVKSTEAGAIDFVGYDLPVHGELYDNGHSLYFKDKLGVDPKHTISGGPLPSGVTYQLVQVHWHWGSENNNGSEHTVAGEKYSMELHMVHFNVKYDTPDEAFKHMDGAAVITFFYKLSEEKNTGLDELMEFIEEISGHGVDYVINPVANITFNDFLPIHLDHKYFYYNGSFTTPPCTEEVTWIIFNETETISSAQLDSFRKLKNHEGHPLQDTFRPIQPLNGRKVFASKFVT